MKKYFVLWALMCFMTTQAYALQGVEPTLALSDERAEILLAYADDIFANKDTNTPHNRITDIEGVVTFAPVRVYANREGVFVHTFAKRGVEEGYLITPKGTTKTPEQPMMTVEKITDRIYLYRFSDYKG